MKTYKQILFEQKPQLFSILLTFIIAGMVIVFREPLHGIFGENNYISIHLIIEMFVSYCSLAIAIQILLSSRFDKNSRTIYIGALFLAIGILVVMHALSYKGMPFFIHDSDPYAATWFYMATRLMFPIGVLVIMLVKEKQMSKSSISTLYVASFLFSIAIAAIVYAPSRLLPELVDADGVTALKSNLQLVAFVLTVALLIVLIKQMRSMPRRAILMIAASLNLLCSDIMFVTYSDVYDIYNFTGHIFQLMAYWLLFKSIYYATAELPFISLMEANRTLGAKEKKIKQLAYYDEGTRLPNERFLLEHLSEHLLEDTSPKALIVLGVDRHEGVKNSLGTAYADKMLEIIAQRLRELLPHGYLLIKLPEDRFAVFMPSYDNAQAITSFTYELQQMMHQSLVMDHFSVSSVFNIGISLYPADAKNAGDLLQFAQFAAYEAAKKEERIAFYTVCMQEDRAAKLVLEHDLKRAIERGELFLEYQPQLDLHRGAIRSVEALVRWRHPEKGMVAPLDFIPLAEESGLIVPIGKWVLETACQETVKWQQKYNRPMKVAVNLSIGQLYQKDFIQFVRQTLERTGLEPSHLQLEITESMTVNTRLATPVLQGLKDLGVTIAVDDFGTGYSSLAYLKDFPIDYLKIDRSFIRNILDNPDDEALVKMILSMAKHMKLKVVAEGIETAEQLDYLVRSDCDKIQGYFISRPIPYDAFESEYQKIQQFADEQLRMLKPTK
ncbi:MAG: EAL domain-containing protein [Lysinibacillus sp.]